MNKSKKLFLVSITTLVLVVGAIFVSNMQKSTFVSKEFPLISMKKEEISTLDFKKSNAAILLTKTSSGWTMNENTNEYVDSKKIDELLLSLEQSKIGAPLSSNPDNFAQYEMSPGLMETLTITSNKSSNTLSIGKIATTDYNHTYVQIDNKIYEASGVLTGMSKDFENKPKK